MNVNIALDQCVGYKRAEQLRQLGYNVVCMANQGESDQDWMKRAHEKKALFAISADSDIPKIIEKQTYPMCWIIYPIDDMELKKDLIGYVDRMIKFKILFYSQTIQNFLEGK